jgi:hypothetical protein
MLKLYPQSDVTDKKKRAASGISLGQAVLDPLMDRFELSRLIPNDAFTLAPC